MVGQQVLPMTPYPGMVGGRPIYPAGQVPSLPIPRLKTQPPPARTSKRSNVLGSKEETSGDKKRARRKLAAAASVAVMSLLCVAMLLGPFNDTPIISGGDMDISSNTRVSGIRVGGRVLTSWNDSGNPFNLNQSSQWKPGPGWTPLEEGEYGPEREGITRIYSSRPSDRKKTKIINLEKKGARMEAGTRSPWQQLLGMNSSVPTSSERGSQGQPDCFGPLEAPIFVGSTFPVNMTEPFAASLFVPRDNRLVQVNGNLIIQAVMAGDKAAMQSSGKTPKAGIKKGKALKTVSTKALEAKGARLPTQAVLVADKAVAANQKSQHGNSNTVPSVVQPGSLQQWVMGGLQGMFDVTSFHCEPSFLLNPTSLHNGTPFIHHVGSHFLSFDFLIALKETDQKDLNKQEGKKPKSLVAIHKTQKNNGPYAVVPRGPLHSWVFSGLSTGNLHLSLFLKE